MGLRPFYLLQQATVYCNDDLRQWNMWQDHMRTIKCMYQRILMSAYWFYNSHKIILLRTHAKYTAETASD
jgi:hypothetical protein